MVKAKLNKTKNNNKNKTKQNKKINNYNRIVLIKMQANYTQQPRVFVNFVSIKGTLSAGNIQ